MSRKKPSQIWHPRYWPTWLGVGLLALVRALPFDWQLALGTGIGKLGYRVARSRHHIAATNVRLCFPEKTPLEQDKLVREIFINSAIGLLETSFAWSGQVERIQHRFQINGLQHLKSARANGKGVMLLGMHFSTLDLCGAVLGREVPFHVMYRKNKNPVIEKAMSDGRLRNFPAAIERANVRAVIKALKAGEIVWYGPDQDYGPKQSVFAPFFGVSAASITATARITSMANAVVIPFSHYRTADNQYVIDLGEPLVDFPSGNDEADAGRVNQIVESAVRKAPAQYWWVHRRFKTRPPGEKRPY